MQLMSGIDNEAGIRGGLSTISSSRPSAASSSITWVFTFCDPDGTCCTPSLVGGTMFPTFSAKGILKTSKQTMSLNIAQSLFEIFKPLWTGNGKQEIWMTWTVRVLSCIYKLSCQDADKHVLLHWYQQSVTCSDLPSFLPWLCILQHALLFHAFQVLLFLCKKIKILNKSRVIHYWAYKNISLMYLKERILFTPLWYQRIYNRDQHCRCALKNISKRRGALAKYQWKENLDGTKSMLWQCLKETFALWVWSWCDAICIAVQTTKVLRHRPRCYQKTGEWWVWEWRQRHIKLVTSENQKSEPSDPSILY